MGTWNSRGLRGSTLEEMVNRTNEWYLEKGLALMQKIPTPITPVKMDKEHRQITLAYFDQRSTIDYIGAIQGIPACFDAKECVAETFPLQNIHEHQVTFMAEFEKQGGIAFILIYYIPGIFCTICDLRNFTDSGCGPKKAAEKVSGSTNGFQILPGVYEGLLRPLSGCYESGSGVAGGT